VTDHGSDYPDHKPLGPRTDVNEVLERLGGLSGVVFDMDADTARARAWAALTTGTVPHPDGVHRVTPEALERARQLLTEGGWIEQGDGTFTPPPRRPLPWQRGR